MGISIADNIGTSRHFSPDTEAKDIEFILRLTERLPMFLSPVVEDLKNGTPVNEIQRQMEAILMNLVEISDQIAVIMPEQNTNTH